MNVGWRDDLGQRPSFAGALVQRGGGTCTRDWTASAASANSASITSEPWNGVAKRSRVNRVACGPIRPPTTPPASTSEIARRAMLRCRNLGGGEPVLQADRVVHADDAGGHAEQREASPLQRERAHDASDDVDRSARHEPRAASDLRHPQRHRHRRQRRAEHVRRRAERRQRLVFASENPTRPFIEIRPDALVSSSAWQQARRKMSRREVCT